MDAQEIRTAVAHQDAARAAAEVPFVNLADPARALGPDGKLATSRRAPSVTLERALTASKFAEEPELQSTLALIPR